MASQSAAKGVGLASEKDGEALLLFLLAAAAFGAVQHTRCPLARLDGFRVVSRAVSYQRRHTLHNVAAGSSRWPVEYASV